MTDDNNGEDREAKIREHAYNLWEKEGQPEGRAQTHWDMACKAVSGDALHAAGTMSNQIENDHAIEPAKKSKSGSKTKDAAKPAPKPKRQTKA